LKARAQYTSDRKLQQHAQNDVTDYIVKTMQPIQQVKTSAFGPKRKQSAFVKEEELQCVREDRAGTPHNSELEVDYEVFAPLSVEELSMGGEADVLAAGLNIQ
jgi:hypothetical protein